MSLTDKILKELNIQKKQEIGSGTEHMVYPSLNDPDVVLKTGWNIDRYEDAAERHPTVLAQVYKRGPRYIVVERLDTETLEEENRILAKALNDQDSPLTPYDRPVCDAFALMSVNLYAMSEYFDLLSTYLQEYPSGLVREVWNRWEPFLKKIEVLDLDGDAAVRNAGYDQHGRLKLLDI